MILDPVVIALARKRQAYVVRVEVMGRFVPGAKPLVETMSIVNPGRYDAVKALIDGLFCDACRDDTPA